MSLAVARLTTLDDLRECASLQRNLVGRGSGALWSVSQLSAVVQSGGLVHGIRAAEPAAGPLLGALIDLQADAGGHRSLHTVFFGVRAEERNHGLGQALRRAERTAASKMRVAVITWAMDPLRSVEAHIAFNKLGAIAAGYSRNLLGELDDPANRGLASDRLQVEWWIESPRTLSVCDRGRPPPHFDLGLHEMTVLTETTLHATGVRAVTGFDRSGGGRYVLVEVPVDIDRVRAVDLDVAREWRIVTREAFELLFERGYVVVGFVHEGGRSFHLFERTTRGAVLGREG
jgi:predicted GNAT superfamily acetyltransferase